MELNKIREEKELRAFYKEKGLKTEAQKIVFLKKAMDILMENGNPKDDLFMLEGLVLSGGGNYFKGEETGVKLINCDTQII